MQRRLWLSLAVSDVNASTDCYLQLGFGFALQFSDDSANCILLSDHLYLMLLTKARFASFSPNPLVNSHAHGFEDLDGDVWELLSMEMPQASV